MGYGVKRRTAVKVWWVTIVSPSQTSLDDKYKLTVTGTTFPSLGRRGELHKIYNGQEGNLCLPVIVRSKSSQSDK